MYVDSNDLEIFRFNDVVGYEMKDFAGIVQKLYAIQALNTTILFENEKISLINQGDDGIQFSYGNYTIK